MASDFEGIMAQEVGSDAATDQATTPGFMDMMARKRTTRPSTHQPQLVFHSRRFRRVLAGLRNEWDQVRPWRHAQTTGMIFGQMALNPKLSATSVLDDTVNFVLANGPFGVDGVLFSALSFAQWLNPQGFQNALSRLGGLSDKPLQNPKAKMNIFFCDFGLGGPQVNAFRNPAGNFRGTADQSDQRFQQDPFFFDRQDKFGNGDLTRFFDVPSHFVVTSFPDTFRNFIFTNREQATTGRLGLETASDDNRGFGAGLRDSALTQFRSQNRTSRPTPNAAVFEDGLVGMMWTTSSLLFGGGNSEFRGSFVGPAREFTSDFNQSGQENSLEQVPGLWLSGIAFQPDPRIRDTKRTHPSQTNPAAGLPEIDDHPDSFPANNRPFGQTTNGILKENEHELQDWQVDSTGICFEPDDVRFFAAPGDFQSFAEQDFRQTSFAGPGTFVLKAANQIAITRGGFVFPAPERLGSNSFLIPNPLRMNQRSRQLHQPPAFDQTTRLADEDIERIAVWVANILRPAGPNDTHQ